MATTTTYRCGHTATVSTVGEDKTYTRQDICRDCAAQAARESAATAQREQAARRPPPELPAPHLPMRVRPVRRLHLRLNRRPR